MRLIVDNDVLFKGACYGLLRSLVSAVCSLGDGIGILGAARYVVKKKLSSARLRGSIKLALVAFSDFLAASVELEPLTEEQETAADLEFQALKRGWSLDVGESQLCAILVHRGIPLMLTGDKRAISALEKLVDVDARLLKACGKVLCLEQAFVSVVTRDGVGLTREAVCAEPEVDKTLTVCFGCTSGAASKGDHLDGLRSYVAWLRGEAPRVLVP